MTKYRGYREFTPQGVVGVALSGLVKNAQHEGQQPAALLPSFVFIAFAIEAYINWVGSQHIEIWSDLERQPWKKKVSILYRATGRDVDWGSKHLQFATEMFKLRDKLAHGKAEVAYGPARATEEGALEDSRGLQAPAPGWHADVTLENLVRAQNGYREFVADLGALYGRPSGDAGILALTGVEETSDEAGA